MTSYGTEEAAFRRAETVRLQGKWWPGVIRHRDGTFSLTYDPLDEVAPDLPSAAHSELGREKDRRLQRERESSTMSRWMPGARTSQSVPAGVERRLP